MTARTLLLMRHARAEGFADDDHSRRLTESGARDAVATGRWLAAHAPAVDLALVSSAVRARETFAGVGDGASLDLEPHVEDAMYAAAEDSALEVLRAVPDATGTVLWVGHNPTVAMLAQALSDEDSDPDALVSLTRGYPTAAVAVLSLSGPWSSLAAGTARLTALHAPD
ncbi:putative phosphoglycerate/bisphosphoglycerate mutase [Marmoricola endophyticus]|uniref:Phosphoglycerate/bisphosphoglycerate mutase n=1 Tax=Marmoricola endophyticus TaxID=2040280 RepID=A0A917BBD9_9ACTN|nr:histidine phosphatase family protein [Marmoricola endophyticus]GGF33968.1 putative phosphoglycerate/bisphosphoglycerate mutase [Marmoricola endophyticus]